MSQSHRQRFTLRSHERLKLRKQIETLFSKGEAFSVFPIRIVFLLQPAESNSGNIRIGFSIPKKKIKKAYQRNLIKRRLREAWRLHKHTLSSQIKHGYELHCFIIYLDDKIAPYSPLENAVKKAIDKLTSALV